MIECLFDRGILCLRGTSRYERLCVINFNLAVNYELEDPVKR